jgi:SulP family sulfate permease
MSFSAPTLVSWTVLREELRMGGFFPSLVTSSILAMLTVVLSVSFVALIFVDPIAGFVGEGSSLMLWTAVVAAVGMALFSSYAGMIAVPQDRVAPIIAIMASFLIQRMRDHASPESIAITVMASIALSAVAVGLVFYFLGIYRLGNIVRFIPYPVIGGFMAGSGWLLLTGSIRVMGGQAFSLTNIGQFFSSGLFSVWLPCAAFGTVTYLGVRFSRHYLTLPALVFAGILFFYVGLDLGHVSWAAARSHGWILGTVAASGPQQIRFLPALFEINWSLIFGQYGSIGAILLISIVSLLLNISALELAADEEIDLNKELRAGGLVNLASGLTGGMVAFQSLSLSAIPIRMGVRSRLVGLFSAFVCLLLLWFGTNLLGYIPRFILGGILFYNGLSFLAEWIFDAYFRLHREDYLLVVLILAIVAMAGYLQGVAAGVLIATVLFVVKYSTVNVISYSLSGDGHQSLVDRSPAESRVLNVQGAQIHILRLKGFIFFGSANNLLESVRQRHVAVGRPKLGYLILDFHHVSGMDTSGLVSMSKLLRLARKERFLILAASVPPALEETFRTASLIGEGADQVKLFGDRDHALEWCENEILQRELSVFGEPVRTLPQILREAHPWRVDTSGLLNYIEQIDVEKDRYLFLQGDAPDALYFIESGKVKVVLKLDNGRTMRIRTMGAGTVVGEIGFYLEQNRVASVITEEPCRMYRFTMTDLRRMEEETPALASAFHEFMVRILAERVTQQNRTLVALVD